MRTRSFWSPKTLGRCTNGIEGGLEVCVAVIPTAAGHLRATPTPMGSRWEWPQEPWAHGPSKTWRGERRRQRKQRRPKKSKSLCVEYSTGLSYSIFNKWFLSRTYITLYKRSIYIWPKTFAMSNRPDNFKYMIYLRFVCCISYRERCN